MVGAWTLPFGNLSYPLRDNSRVFKRGGSERLCEKALKSRWKMPTTRLGDASSLEIRIRQIVCVV